MHDRKPLSDNLLVLVLGASLAGGCYVGIDDAGQGVAEFGDELGGSESDTVGLETGTSSGGDTSDAGTTDSGTTTTDSGTTTTDTGTSTTDTSTSTSTTDTGTTTTDTGDPMEGDLPNNAYCTPVSNWNAAWVQLELDVIVLVNQARAQGGNCGTEGNFPASGPLTWEPHLTCAARVHSQDMAVNDFFSHTNLQGNGPGWRLDQAGFAGGTWGENIAAGYPDPDAVVQGWLDSDGHCSNMLNPDFSLIGVGYAYDAGASYGSYWTQNFGG